MAKEIKIPQISEDVDSATVTEILVSEGDTIKKDDSLIAVESDKASVEIPSPEAGTVKSIKLSEGDEVKVGDVILTLEIEDGDSENKDAEDADSEEETEDTKEKSKKEKKSKESGDKDDSEDEKKEDEKKSKEVKDDDSKEKGKDKDDAPEEEDESKDEQDEKKLKEKTSGSEGVPAAPGTRRLARELGVDISEVKSSSEDGRISKEDVKNHNKNSGKQSSSLEDLSLPDFSEWGETERKPLSGIRKVTAKKTSAAWSTIPHVFQFDEADISDIEEYLEKLQEKTEDNITITSILIKIAAGALRQFPKFNASIDLEKEEMILKKYVNIGVAVDTEKGLLLPVIRNADQKTILDIALEITELAEKARDGNLSKEEMEGGNFTVSNLGGIGGTNFTPIIYHPQVAILGVSRAKTQPVYMDGNFEPREILPLSLSYDHRLIDGAQGARFLHWIARALENPYEALLGA